TIQCAAQIVSIREVLHDRVQDDGVKEAVGQSLKIISRLLVQLNTRGKFGMLCKRCLQRLDRLSRKIRAIVVRTCWCEPPEQKSASNADLQHVGWLKR